LVCSYEAIVLLVKEELIGEIDPQQNFIDDLETEYKVDDVNHEKAVISVKLSHLLSECIHGAKNKKHEKDRDVSAVVERHRLEKLENESHHVEELVLLVEVIAVDEASF